MSDEAEDDELDDEEVRLCPHGYDALNECPICDVVYYDMEDEEMESCQILLEHATLAGPSRALLEKMIMGEGRDYDGEYMRELFQMHLSTLHQHQK